MATRTEISRKCRYRGKNNEYGTVYYIREFFTKCFKPTVVWSVNRIELSGAGRKKGDIEIVVNGETVVLSQGIPGRIQDELQTFRRSRERRN